MLWNWKVSRRVVRERDEPLPYTVQEVWSLFNIPMRTYDVAYFADRHDARLYARWWRRRRDAKKYCQLAEDSDVFLYESSVGIICGTCQLDPEYGDRELPDVKAALEQLRQHQVAGHMVPQEAVRRLQKEKESRPAPSNKE